jgi:hypothetical protein
MSRAPVSPEKQWIAKGLRLSRSARSVMWQIGDWWNNPPEGTNRVEVVKSTKWERGGGLNHSTCWNAGWLANRFPPSCRHEGLTFEHHAAVAALPDAQAVPLLEWAAAEGKTREELRTRVKQLRRDACEVELAEAIEEQTHLPTASPNRSAYFWLKPGPGTGYWSTTDQIEILLVGTVGNPPAPELVPMAALTLDPELQPRASIDRVVLENYVQLLVDGAVFPPVVAFRDDAVLWLADGFHRWHSRKVLDLDDIEVDVRIGTRRDALLYSLSANSKHGLQRNTLDYRRAYDIAVNNKLVDPTDIEAVAQLLGCSGRWAESLTQPAREAAKAARVAEIRRLHDEGMSVREVARETGGSIGTVHRTITGVPTEHSADLEHPEPQPDPGFERYEPEPPPSLREVQIERAKEELRELASPPAQNWASALRALRHVNEQIPVEELFIDRYRGFDGALWPELEAACHWINELYERFHHEGDDAERRRA